MKNQNLTLSAIAAALLLATSVNNVYAAGAVATTCTPATYAAAGFSLIFKDCNGTVAKYHDKTECVRDNATGLIWQGHMPAKSKHIRANDQYKTNFNSTAGNQNSNAGSPIPATQAQINAANNAIGFQNAINASKLCGLSAWRIPTVEELKTIVKGTKATAIDNNWFPNTPPTWYWTSSPHHNTDDYAWSVYFLNGDANYVGRDQGLSFFDSLVRLVHD